MDQLLAGLRAAAEPTRLRLLALCARAELTVTELTQILGQSQPRVSRHLKLLSEAALIDRFREGAWAYYRLAAGGPGEALARTLIDLVPTDDAQLGRDLERLESIKAARARAAAEYFRANAERWDDIRSLYVPESEVETALLRLFGDRRIPDFLDIGTGTGRILEVFAGRVERGLGVDLSHDMLRLARARLEQAGVRHCQVRHGDMYNLALAPASFDAVVIHQVLRYAEAPGAVVAEAARMLRSGGLLAIVDFASHEVELLRAEHRHRWLGFDDAEVARWRLASGLEPGPVEALPGDPVTVKVWTARRPQRAAAPALEREAVR
jgi:ubiquinone/menaquinone biosynthesis C-methylase UbiE/DNA-binding transcriptional ArsR family regulator